MSVQDIEQAIVQLPPSDLAELMAWLREHQQVWDEQIEDDLESGRLDALMAEAESEYEAGQAQPL